MGGGAARHIHGAGRDDSATVPLLPPTSRSPRPRSPYDASTQPTINILYFYRCFRYNVGNWEF